MSSDHAELTRATEPRRPDSATFPRLAPTPQPSTPARPAPRNSWNRPTTPWTASPRNPVSVPRTRCAATSTPCCTPPRTPIAGRGSSADNPTPVSTCRSVWFPFRIPTPTTDPERRAILPSISAAQVHRARQRAGITAGRAVAGAMLRSLRTRVLSRNRLRRCGIHRSDTTPPPMPRRRGRFADAARADLAVHGNPFAGKRFNPEWYRAERNHEESR